MGFLRLLRPWGFSHEARLGSQGTSRVAPGKSGIHAHGEGERVMALESWEGTRASTGVEEGLSRSFSGCGGKPSFPSTSARDLNEIPMVPLRGEGCCGVGEGPLGSSLGLAQWKRASPPWEAGTSGPLRFVLRPSDLRVPAELGAES